LVNIWAALQQVPANPCVVNFGTKMCNVFAQKITVDALDNKLDDSVKEFYFSIFYEVLAVCHGCGWEQRSEDATGTFNMKP
jgi:hypothetical protein